MSRFTENTFFLNSYRIEKSIGQGAFGEVYLATHTRLNGQRAVKVLLRDEIGVGSSDYDEYRNRFRQESQLMELFKDPHLVMVYDFQEEDNTLFLIMEYAAGGSLKQRLDTLKKDGRLFNVEETVKIGIDIARGLAALHQKDVVHRDLKPSNILFDADGNAKVADLGLAQVPGGASMRSQLSVPKPHPGTPAYMSPEQETAGSYLRPASDIYSLGLMLFEMLTGRSYKSLRPGTRLKTLAPESPEWLDDLLARMLSENPKDRPWDGVEAAEDLRKGLASGDNLIKKAQENKQKEEENIRLKEQERLKITAPEKTTKGVAERTPPVDKTKKSESESGSVKKRALTVGIILAVLLSVFLLVRSFSTPQEPAPTAIAVIPTQKSISSPVTKPSVGIVLPTKDGTRWTREESWFLDAFSSAGYDVEILFSQNNSATEAANVQTLISKGIKVLIIYPVDRVAAASAVQQARAANVKVISYDSLIQDTNAVDFYVTCDNFNVGVSQAEYLVKKAGTRKGIPLYIYTGAISDSYSYELFKAAWAILKNNLVDGTFSIQNSSEAIAAKTFTVLSDEQITNIINQTTTGWDPAMAKDLASKNLAAANSSGKGDVFILAPNDFTARAISETFAADKNISSFVITGQDAEKESIQYVIDGKQSMTLLKNGRALNQGAVDSSIAFLQGSTPKSSGNENNGKTMIPVLWTKVTTITRDNITPAIIDSGYYPASFFTGLN